jgi:hypothetical protein
VLDFIGNYKRANLIRDYLAKRMKVIEIEDASGRRRRKVEYEYSTGCEVLFDPTVEEILDRQDSEGLGVSKVELQEAYYALAEKLGRKPSRSDIDAEGEYKSGVYARIYGSWSRFIREIGEYTEASYHYPQGTHVGHILAIVWYFGLPSRQGTPFEDQYIRLRGELGTGRLSAYRRQVKYKLQAAMELGLLEDDRRAPPDGEFIPKLTPLGREFRAALASKLRKTDLNFPVGQDGVPGTSMAENEGFYNEIVRKAIAQSEPAALLIRRPILRMSAVQQMMAFLYQVCRATVVERKYIYENFFQAPFVRQFLDQEGIEEATLEASRRRCPFLLNLLEAIGLVESEGPSIKLNSLMLIPPLVRAHTREVQEASIKRLKALKAAWPDKAETLHAEDLSILRELFGATFLTPAYPIKKATFLEKL